MGLVLLSAVKVHEATFCNVIWQDDSRSLEKKNDCAKIAVAKRGDKIVEIS